MSIKETIKFKGNDVFLNIPLKIGNSLVDYQQEIDNLNEKAKEDLINQVVDNEVQRFSYKSGLLPTNLSFYFNNDSTSFYNSFLLYGAGFTIDEIEKRSNNILNSFFIMDFYDSFNSYTQKKIFTTYLTKIIDGEKSNGRSIPTYNIDSNIPNQFYHWYVPKTYLDPYLYSGYTTIVGYIKFSFYNAKDGKISLFYNKANQSLNTPEKMYFNAYLYLNTMEWQLSTDIPQAYEVYSSNKYVNRVNDRTNTFDNKKQNYPIGNTFQSDDGTYITV